MEKNKGNSRWKAMGKALKMELREHKSSFLVYVILRALVICVMILQIFNRNFENVFLCILTLILLIVPSFIQVNLKIEFPTGLEIILLFFIFAAENFRRNTGILHKDTGMGYCFAYYKWISDGGDRIFVGRYFEQE